MFDHADALRRYARDRTPAAFEALAAEALPLIRSICRRHLRDPHDVDDAAQETLLKLARHADAIDGSLTAWISAAARSSSVDLIRRAAAGRRRALSAADRPCFDGVLTWEAARQRLQDALAIVDPATRSLVVARFLRGHNLSALAAADGTSVPTASRRIKRAIEDLRLAYAELGFDTLDDTPLEALIDPFNPTRGAHAHAARDALRFAADWRALADHLEHRGDNPAALPPGWTRPIRVGVLVSHLTTRVVTLVRITMPVVEQQLASVRLPKAPGYEFVAIVEPDTESLPGIERSLRHYDLTAGLVDGSDAEALATLDAIVVGNNYATAPSVITALHEAVRRGTGFYSQGWLACHSRPRPDSRLAELLLSDGPTYKYHHPLGCSARWPMTVCRRHPMLPNLREGDLVEMGGCGLWVRPAPGCEVLVTNTLAASPRADLPRPMPLVRAGRLGRGRVFVCASVGAGALYAGRDAGAFLENAIRWLAEPRRTEPA